MSADGSGYPDDNPKTIIGVRKPPLSLVPPVAIVHTARAMKDGADKYGPYNWRAKTVSSSIYVDAAERHIMSWWDGEEVADDSGVHHLGHAIACMAILLDAQSIGRLNDDRPFRGQTAQIIEALTRREKGE